MHTPQPLVKTPFAKAVFFSFLVPVLLVGQAMGAVILWDAAPTDVNVNDATQVLNVGTLIAAASNYPVGTVTVNTVTFQAWNSATNFTGPAAGNPNYQGGAPTTDYSKLVTYGEWMTQAQGAGNPMVFGGLTMGQQYKFQVWTSYWNGSWPTQFGGVSNGTDNSATLYQGFGAQPVPQFIFGTFTADSTTQNLYQFGVSDYSVIGAVQLRAVPEPATITLLAFGGLALVLRRKFRQSRLTA